MIIFIMIISFFEEFPSKQNLNKLKLIKFPTKLYLAAHSLKEFKQFKSQINNKYIKEFIYWPILQKSEGYWFSPFSKKTALKRIFNELKDFKVPVMIDLELPTTKNPILYLTQSFNFFKNKNLIQEFINNYSSKIYLAEYYPVGRRGKVLKLLGLHYLTKKVQIIKMLYHSMHNFDTRFILDEFKTGKKEFGNRFIIALGTIAKGAKGNEPILSLSKLKNDLDLAQKSNLKEVIIFRLGGLNKNYSSLLKQYSSF